MTEVVVVVEVEVEAIVEVVVVEPEDTHLSQPLTDTQVWPDGQTPEPQSNPHCGRPNEIGTVAFKSLFSA